MSCNTEQGSSYNTVSRRVCVCVCVCLCGWGVLGDVAITLQSPGVSVLHVRTDGGEELVHLLERERVVERLQRVDGGNHGAAFKSCSQGKHTQTHTVSNTLLLQDTSHTNTHTHTHIHTDSLRHTHTHTHTDTHTQSHTHSLSQTHTHTHTHTDTHT